MMYLMKCGHVSNAVTGGGKPACAVCGCVDVARGCAGTEGLEGRKARCFDCGRETDSRWSLDFFRHCPDREHDTWYCGCRGWD